MTDPRSKLHRCPHQGCRNQHEIEEADCGQHGELSKQRQELMDEMEKKFRPSGRGGWMETGTDW